MATMCPAEDKAALEALDIDLRGGSVNGRFLIPGDALKPTLLREWSVQGQVVARSGTSLLALLAKAAFVGKPGLS
jgi:hypothetical protein